MPEFFNVLAPDQALQVLKQHLLPNVETDPIATSEALGRVTAQDILSPEDLPAFPRSTMDGYSVPRRRHFRRLRGPSRLPGSGGRGVHGPGLPDQPRSGTGGRGLHRRYAGKRRRRRRHRRAHPARGRQHHRGPPSRGPRRERGAARRGRPPRRPPSYRPGT